MSRLVEAAIETIPGQAATLALSTGGANTLDLSTYVGKWITFMSTVDWHPRAAATTPGDATASDLKHAADVLHKYYVSARRQVLKIYVAGAGTLSYAVTSESL